MLGRKLDWVLNVLLNAGPIIGGAAMIDHFEDFGEFADVGDLFFTQIPAYMEGIHGTLSWVTLTIGSLFIVFYRVAYWRLARRGYLVSWLKVWLYATTGFTSIFAWGFNAFGEAFFIMNLFHAIQYFGIVWAREKNQMASSLGLRNVAGGLAITLLLFLGLTGSYGYWVEQLNTDVRPLWAITLVVSIMHFWYDGFIWSVRRREV